MSRCVELSLTPSETVAARAHILAHHRAQVTTAAPRLCRRLPTSRLHRAARAGAMGVVQVVDAASGRRCGDIARDRQAVRTDDRGSAASGTHGRTPDELCGWRRVRIGRHGAAAAHLPSFIDATARRRALFGSTVDAEEARGWLPRLSRNHGPSWSYVPDYDPLRSAAQQRPALGSYGADAPS